MDLPGALAEYVSVRADQVYEVPQEIRAADASMVQPISISYHGVVDRAQVQPSETVLVIGAGPIGLAAVQLITHLGARAIVADVLDDRLTRARQLGADLTIRADIDSLADGVREATGGRGADVTIEAVGGGQDRSLRDAVEATATRGRIVVLGTFGKRAQSFPGYEFKNRELTMLGSHGHPRTFAPALRLVTEGLIEPAALITHTLPLSQSAQAFETLDRRLDGVVKVILEPRSH
jgi:threonine dehydrogenase-like Zn-dependent dehydrogenase